MRKQQEWELVNTNVFDDTYRMMVPGGWIVKIMKENESSALLYYPDKDHRWTIDG